MTLGDRVVVMKDGVVQQVGEPLDLYHSPATRFVAGFIGSPGMNFAKVKVTEGGGELRIATEGLDLALPSEHAVRLQPYVGREVILGMRPEDLRVVSGSEGVTMAFDAAIEVVEKLGSQILLDLQVGRDTMVAAVEPTVAAKYGERVRIAPNPARLHFFDVDTDAAI
jgi:multiple sugar transport system ATP-binding protein